MPPAISTPRSNAPPAATPAMVLLLFSFTIGDVVGVCVARNTVGLDVVCEELFEVAGGFCKGTSIGVVVIGLMPVGGVVGSEVVVLDDNMMGDKVGFGDAGGVGFDDTGEALGLGVGGICIV